MAHGGEWRVRPLDSQSNLDSTGGRHARGSTSPRYFGMGSAVGTLYSKVHFFFRRGGDDIDAEMAWSAEKMGDDPARMRRAVFVSLELKRTVVGTLCIYRYSTRGFDCLPFLSFCPTSQVSFRRTKLSVGQTLLPLFSRSLMM